MIISSYECGTRLLIGFYVTPPVRKRLSPVPIAGIMYDTSMKLFIGSDHRGFPLKNRLTAWLRDRGHEVIDCGNTVLDPDDDFTTYAKSVAQNISEHPQARGIVICGSGTGVTVAANRIKGVRAALGLSPLQVSASRQEDDVNILSIASDFTKESEAEALVTAFLETSFLSQDRYRKRIQNLDT